MAKKSKQHKAPAKAAASAPAEVREGGDAARALTEEESARVREARGRMMAQQQELAEMCLAARDYEKKVAAKAEECAVAKAAFVALAGQIAVAHKIDPDSATEKWQLSLDEMKFRRVG